MSMELIFCLVAVLVLAVCMAVVLIMHKKQRLHLMQLQESLKNLEQLNFELRAARHDYLNHLQVVYGLLELEEYEDLKKYLTPVYKGIMKTGKALKTSKPALNALLKAKMEEAESKEIDVYVEVKSDLQKLPVEDWQLCKVLSNLIDNAMTALSETTEERKLEIDINEDRENYFFTVSNNGTSIPKEHLENIFKRGFSTKKESGHGMGLAIVSDIVKENRGNISVSSTEERTSFTVGFQKGEGE